MIYYDMYMFDSKACINTPAILNLHSKILKDEKCFFWRNWITFFQQNTAVREHETIFSWSHCGSYFVSSSSSGSSTYRAFSFLTDCLKKDYPNPQSRMNSNWYLKMRHDRHSFFIQLKLRWNISILGTWLLEPSLDVHRLEAGIDQEAFQEFEPWPTILLVL